MVRVKICGITNRTDALLCVELGASAIGLNFYPQSPRAISPSTADKIIRELPPFVSPVGIYVNWSPQAVIALSLALRLAFAQLHGDETPQTVAAVAKKIPVIKALRVAGGSPPAAFSKYRAANAFLLDAAVPGEFGGTGQTGDWTLAGKAAASRRILLAGGLTPENVAEAIAAVHPYAVDVTTGVESRPGKKDVGKLRAFFGEVSRANELNAAASTPNPFVGSWELDPSTLHYEHGRPGLRASYVIESIPGGLQFHLDAEDADQNPIRVTYGGAPDGREQPIVAAGAVTRLSDMVIESSLKRDGKIVDRWTREMLPGHQTMRITQFGIKPNGEEFRNTSLYRRTK
jgi:phosphoribosylanthranilate isomerase